MVKQLSLGFQMRTRYYRPRRTYRNNRGHCQSVSIN